MLSALKSIVNPRRIPRCINVKQSVLRSFSVSSSTRKSKSVKLSKILSEIKQFIDKGNNSKAIETFVAETLDRHSNDTRSAAVAYEKVIDLLTDNGLLVEASAVYARLHTSGYRPSSFTDAKMLALAIASSSEDVDTKSLIEHFRTLFADSTFSVDRFLGVIKVLADSEVAPETMLAVMDHYFDVKKESYLPDNRITVKLVDAQTRSGHMERAHETMKRHAETADASHPSALYPYISVISAIRATRDWDNDSVMRILDLMREHKLHPNISLLNVLIAREVRLGRYKMAFSFYGLVNQLSKTGGDVIPNAFTFGSLFSALKHMYSPRFRFARARARRPTEDAPIIPPRELYRQMIDIMGEKRTKTTTRPSTSTLITSLLNVALRTFVTKRDYAGAFVVLRTFTVYGVPLNLKTYAIIMRHIILRVHGDIHGSRLIGDYRWGDRFLGLAKPVDPRQLTHFDVGSGLARHLLELSSRHSFSIAAPAYYAPETPPNKNELAGKYRVPAFDQLEGLEEVPSRCKLAAVPLERLLRKAVLAELDGPEDVEARVELVSNAISEAKREMVRNPDIGLKSKQGA